MILIKFIFCLFPFFKPFYISQFAGLVQIYNILQICVAVIMFFEFLKGEKLSKTILLICFIEFCLFFSSVLNNLNIFDTLKNVIQTVMLCVLIENFAKKDIKKLFLALKILLVIFLFIDFIFVIKYPLGIRVDLYNVWFFGAKNSQIAYILPTLFVTYIYNFILCKKTRMLKLEFLILFIISFYILFVVNSVTSIIVLLFFLILLLISKNKIYISLSMKKLSIIYFLLFLSIVVFQIQNNFSDLFINILGKDVTFTGRTIIWSDTINFIKNNYLFGFGLEPSYLRVIKMNDISALNSHNMILEIIYNGGFVLFFVFLYFWNHMCKKVDLFSNNNNQILKTILLVYCLELMVEVFAFEQLLWIFVLIIMVSQKGSEFYVKK